jgi:AcrR family transcriptional regulator
MATTPEAATAAPRDRILDAADRLLARFGYRKMTVEDLAREAGMGKGTVYLSFPSKADVALACIDRMADRLLARLQTIAAAPGPEAPKLHAMLLERVMHRFDYARPHSASIDGLLDSIRAPLLERRREYFRREARAIAAVIEQGHRAGAFAVTDATAAARACVFATNSLLPFSLSVEELGQRKEIQRRAEEIAQLLLRGIVAAPSGVRHPGGARRRPRR